MKSSTWLNIWAIIALLAFAILAFMSNDSGFAFIAFSVFASGASICRTIEKQSK